MSGPLRKLESAFFEKYARRIRGDEEAGIADPPRLRVLLWRGLAATGLGTATIFVYPFSASHGWSLISALCAILLGWLIAIRSLSALRKALAYRNGWMDGRREMMRSLGEAAQRGISMPDWLDSQLSKDLETLGISIEEIIENARRQPPRSTDDWGDAS